MNSTQITEKNHSHMWTWISTRWIPSHEGTYIIRSIFIFNKETRMSLPLKIQRGIKNYERSSTTMGNDQVLNEIKKCFDINERYSFGLEMTVQNILFLLIRAGVKYFSLTSAQTQLEAYRNFHTRNWLHT